MNKIIPVILAGGTGSRLWPLSRESFPKQFLKLTDEDKILQLLVKEQNLEVVDLSKVEISDEIILGLAPVYFVEITTSGGCKSLGNSRVLICKKV